MCGTRVADCCESELEGHKAVKITSQADGSVTFVRIDGRIDFATSESLERSAVAVIEGGSPRVVLDMRGVDYISSAGLRAILMVVRKAKSAGGGVAVFGLQPGVDDVFTTAGFGKVVPIATSDAAARQMLSA
jgi:anti-anti-sigma factor